ncbi:DUF5597 domain-containing protein [Alteromonas pelagimontana]|uniref:DUF5597 domain-containing protein n=1 Tax=Alteromonas pelagimontana TaxID=1858656 RepID=A0A6M4MI58_9ALTE|nr:DUF5597 domain-containing protein [Alteromonas pelagimontana]QJR82280.1 DUF5597 domain-containing protein [Alteromonas pelagimontana]
MKLAPRLSLYFAIVVITSVTSLAGCSHSAAGAKTAFRSGNNDASLPRVQSENGRHRFIVDNKPFLILGAQTNNSANYSAALADVWPVVEKMQANTLSIPVAWEQIEPQEGQFDFSFLDTLIAEAAAHNVRLNLLWFATWKNNAPHYAPSWVKLDNQRFPRVITKDGKMLNSLSPLGKETLAADKRAFMQLMSYLRDNDPAHRVIMVQVENEVGTYGSKRDFSAMANTQFNAQVPAKLREAMNLPAGSWQQVFQEDADEFFHAWHIATYVEEIAQAGKQIKNLPMNVNVALRNPFTPGDGYSMGGPTDNVIDLWKIAAPSIDMISPDIYFRDFKTVARVLELYSRPDNPLFVAEIGNAEGYARYFFQTLGEQGIGFAPFGMDYTDYANFPLGAKAVNDEVINAFAENYRLFAPMAEAWAALSYKHPVWGFAEPDSEKSEDVWNAKGSGDDTASDNEKDKEGARFTQTADLGKWNAEVTYGREMFWINPPTGNDPASGGAAIIKLSENEFLVTAFRARVTFVPSDELKGTPTMIERVEEGHFEGQKWVFERVWNGDQTDWGLNFTSRPHVLKVKMATYRR